MAPKNHKGLRLANPPGFRMANDNETSMSPSGMPAASNFNRGPAVAHAPDQTADQSDLSTFAYGGHNTGHFERNSRVVPDSAYGSRPTMSSAHIYSANGQAIPGNPTYSEDAAEDGTPYSQQQFSADTTNQQNGRGNMVNHPVYMIHQHGDTIHNSPTFINTQAGQSATTEDQTHFIDDNSSHGPSSQPRPVQMPDGTYAMRHAGYDHYWDAMGNPIGQLPVAYGQNLQQPAAATTGVPSPTGLQTGYGQDGVINPIHVARMNSKPQQMNPGYSGTQLHEQNGTQMGSCGTNNAGTAQDEQSQPKRRRLSPPDDQDTNAVPQQQGIPPNAVQHLSEVASQHSAFTAVNEGRVFARTTLNVHNLRDATVNATLRAPLKLAGDDDWKEMLRQEDVAIMLILQAFDVPWAEAPNDLTTQALTKWNNSQQSQHASMLKLLNKKTTHADHAESAARVLFHAILDAHTKGGPRIIGTAPVNTKLKCSDRIVAVIDSIKRYSAVRHDVMAGRRLYELASNPVTAGSKKMSNAINNDFRNYNGKGTGRGHKGKSEDMDEFEEAEAWEESEAEFEKLVKRGRRREKSSPGVTGGKKPAKRGGGRKKQTPSVTAEEPPVLRPSSARLARAQYVEVEGTPDVEEVAQLLSAGTSVSDDAEASEGDGEDEGSYSPESVESGQSAGQGIDDEDNGENEVHGVGESNGNGLIYGDALGYGGRQFHGGGQSYGGQTHGHAQFLGNAGQGNGGGQLHGSGQAMGPVYGGNLGYGYGGDHPGQWAPSNHNA